MAKIFYDHLVVLEEVTTILKTYQLSNDEHEEIVELMNKTIHHEVLSVILKKLPAEKHKDFLKMFHVAPHDVKLLDFLKNEIENIEEEIKTVAEKVKKEFLVEIKRATK